ncbi:hypothetical protein BpHYR1_048735 [Brachionus plicatilis]
MLGQN